MAADRLNELTIQLTYLLTHCQYARKEEQERGSTSAQQGALPAPVYPPQYPYPGPPITPGPAVRTDNGILAQLQLLGKLHDTNVLTDDEFEREKQQILNRESEEMK